MPFRELRLKSLWDMYTHFLFSAVKTEKKRHNGLKECLTTFNPTWTLVLIKKIYSFHFLSCGCPRQDGTGCQNPVPSRPVVKCQSSVPSKSVPWQNVKILSRPILACPVKRFWPCPGVPMSWDNKGTSVPLICKTRLSRPVGNPRSIVLWILWNHNSLNAPKNTAD